MTKHLAGGPPAKLSRMSSIEKDTCLTDSQHAIQPQYEVGDACTSTVTSHVESSPSRAFVVVSCQVAGREHRSACAAPS